MDNSMDYRPSALDVGFFPVFHADPVVYPESAVS